MNMHFGYKKNKNLYVDTTRSQKLNIEILISLSDALAQHSELNAIALVAAIGRTEVTMG